MLFCWKAGEEIWGEESWFSQKKRGMGIQKSRSLVRAEKDRKEGLFGGSEVARLRLFVVPRFISRRVHCPAR